MKKRIITTTLALVLSSVLCACGSSASENYTDSYESSREASVDYDAAAANSDYDYSSDEAITMYDEASSGSTDTTVSENATSSNRKLVRTVSLDVETKEFDSLLAGISEDISSLGGYIESMDGSYGSIYSSYRSSKNATIVARIPADKLDGFINSVGDMSNITYRSESVEDITLNYVDMESHKKMLLEEQDRLLEFLDQAETIEDIISLEDRLTSVKYEIDSMESQLRTYDNKVDYSTVTIDVSEVVDYTEPVEPELTAGQRMATGFLNSLANIGNGLKELGIWLVVNLPYIVLIAIIAVIIILIVRAVNKKNAAKLEEIRRKRAENQSEAAADTSIYVARPEQTKKDE